MAAQGSRAAATPWQRRWLWCQTCRELAALRAAGLPVTKQHVAAADHSTDAVLAGSRSQITATSIEAVPVGCRPASIEAVLLSTAVKH